MKLRRGNLKLVRHLAKGGIAQLTLAADDRGNSYVLRELHSKYIFNARMQFRFNRGIRVRRSITPHENICGTVSLGFAGLRPYEIIEYVPGRNLRDLIHNRHESVKTNALEILRKVARGIRYMHDNKILHLDVKPENVLLNTGGDVKDGDRVVKLTDFDLSRRLSGGKSLVRSRAGTASHMAPEQLVKGSVSYGNDIFAFGVLAYYLVTGKMPFDGFTLKEVRRNQVSNNFEIAEPRKVNPDLAPRLSWVIMRCLERDTTERFPNLAYLCRELDRV